jgi:hypothetical protein
MHTISVSSSSVFVSSDEEGVEARSLMRVV